MVRGLIRGCSDDAGQQATLSLRGGDLGGGKLCASSVPVKKLLIKWRGGTVKPARLLSNKAARVMSFRVCCRLTAAVVFAATADVGNARLVRIMTIDTAIVIVA